MAEVEAQLVRADVGAGLAHVAAEALAQRRLQQVRGRVVALGRVASRVIDLREHGLAHAQRSLLHDDREGLVIGETEDVAHAGAAVAVLAFDRADVRDLAASGGIERRLGELHQIAAVGFGHRPHGGELALALIPGEAGHEAALPGERAGRRALPRDLVGAAAAVGSGAGSAARALLVHQRLEVALDREPLGVQQLARELVGKAERVVQAEDLARRHARARGLARLIDQLLQCADALLQSASERLLFGGEPVLDHALLFGELGVDGSHQLAHALGVAAEEASLQVEVASLHDRAAHDPAQDVSALLVGGHDAVCEQEGHGASVIGEYAQRPVDREGLPVAAARELLAELDQRQELVGLEHRRLLLQDRRHAVEAEARVDVLGREGLEERRRDR